MNVGLNGSKWIRSRPGFAERLSAVQSLKENERASECGFHDSLLTMLLWQSVLVCSQRCGRSVNSNPSSLTPQSLSSSSAGVWLPKRISHRLLGCATYSAAEPTYKVASATLGGINATYATARTTE